MIPYYWRCSPTLPNAKPYLCYQDLGQMRNMDHKRQHQHCSLYQHLAKLSWNMSKYADFVIWKSVFSRIVCTPDFADDGACFFFAQFYFAEQLSWSKEQRSNTTDASDVDVLPVGSNPALSVMKSHFNLAWSSEPNDISKRQRTGLPMEMSLVFQQTIQQKQYFHASGILLSSFVFYNWFVIHISHPQLHWISERNRRN